MTGYAFFSMGQSVTFDPVTVCGLLLAATTLTGFGIAVSRKRRLRAVRLKPSRTAGSR